MLEQDVLLGSKRSATASIAQTTKIRETSVTDAHPVSSWRHEVGKLGSPLIAWAVEHLKQRKLRIRIQKRAVDASLRSTL